MTAKQRKAQESQAFFAADGRRQTARPGARAATRKAGR